MRLDRNTNNRVEIYDRETGKTFEVNACSAREILLHADNRQNHRYCTTAERAEEKYKADVAAAAKVLNTDDKLLEDARAAAVKILGEAEKGDPRLTEQGMVSKTAIEEVVGRPVPQAIYASVRKG